MGINFTDIVKQVLTEATVTNLNDPKHWVKKVIDKVATDLRITLEPSDLQKIYNVYGGKPGTYVSGKAIADLNLVSVYDLLYTLLTFVYTKDQLPWLSVTSSSTPATPTTPITTPSTVANDDLVNLIQTRYENGDTLVKGFIDSWLLKSLDEPDYQCASPKIGRAYLEARKELEILERAAFTSYTGMSLLKGLFEVVKKRVSAKEMWRAAALSPGKLYQRQGLGRSTIKLDNVTPFEELLTNIMLSAPKFASGETTGTDYKNIIQKILNIKSTISGQTLSRLAEEVDEIYPKTIITFCLMCRDLFESEVKRVGSKKFNEMFGTGGTSGIEPVEPGDISFTDNNSKITEAFLKFAKMGKIECPVVVAYGRDKALTREMTVTGSVVYTLGVIDTLRTDESMRVVKTFKDLCVYVSSKKKQETNFAGALWAASGQSLYGR